MAPSTATSPTSAAAGCSVRVAVRVRPLLSFEKTERLGECVGCIPNSKQLYVGDEGRQHGDGRNTFTFDFTFPKNCEQRTLYEDCVASLLEGGLMLLVLSTLCSTSCAYACTRWYVLRRVQIDSQNIGVSPLKSVYLPTTSPVAMLVQSCMPAIWTVRHRGVLHTITGQDRMYGKLGSVYI